MKVDINSVRPTGGGAVVTEADVRRAAVERITAAESEIPAAAAVSRRPEDHHPFEEPAGRGRPPQTELRGNYPHYP